jgi:hypothetical protein
MGIRNIVGKLFGKRSTYEADERDNEVETSVELPLSAPRVAADTPTAPRAPRASKGLPASMMPPPEPRLTSAQHPLRPSTPPRRPSPPPLPQRAEQRTPRAYSPRDEHLDSIDCPSDEGLIRDLDPMDADVRRIDTLRARRGEAEGAPSPQGAPSHRDLLEPLSAQQLYVYQHPLEDGAAPPQTERALPLHPPDTQAPQYIQSFVDEQDERGERNRQRRARASAPEPSASRPERSLFRLIPLEGELERPSLNPMERVGGGVYVPSLREVSMRMFGWIQQNAPQNHSGVEGVWRDYLDLCPEDVRAKEGYGWYLLDFKGTDEAVQYFQSQVSTPYGEVFLYNLAQLSFQIADYQAAYDYIENLYGKRLDDVDVLSLKYKIEVKSKRLQNAQETLAQLEKYAPAELIQEVLSGC